MNKLPRGWTISQKVTGPGSLSIVLPSISTPNPVCHVITYILGRVINGAASAANPSGINVASNGPTLFTMPDFFALISPSIPDTLQWEGEVPGSPGKDLTITAGAIIALQTMYVVINGYDL